MSIATVSQNKLKNIFEYWNVDDEYATPLFNYLIYGLTPGSFWASALANNYTDAIISSHPSNQIQNLKNASLFIVNCMPIEAWGSYEIVNNWVKMSEEKRRTILERCDLIYTPEMETWETLKESQ